MASFWALSDALYADLAAVACCPTVLAADLTAFFAVRVLNLTVNVFDVLLMLSPMNCMVYLRMVLWKDPLPWID